MIRPRSLAIALLLLLAAPSNAVVVDTSSPELYESPPADDPGWRNVGRRGSTTAIYLGEGWVLTSRHSAMGAVEFDGVTHEPVTDTLHWLDSPLGGIKADLMMFRITPEPDLPSLALRRRPVSPGEEVVLVGYGRGRGGPAKSGLGYAVDERWVKRWGANVVEHDRENVRGPNETLTRCFTTRFDRDRSAEHEAQATGGDSGGAVFHRGKRRWRLVGVMLSVTSSPSQQRNEALFGNSTHSADLGAYAAQILEILGRPQKSAR